MAVDLEKLVVQLSADFKAYENAMAKASGITRKELAAIKAGAEAAGGGSVVAFTGAAKGARAYGTAAQTAAKQASAAAKSSGALKAQVGNLSAQFQDIAVQLQSGQSPFTIALQQGTQISAVLGGQGAGGAVKALGGAFLSLVSPVSLVTIGLIAAGGAAVQYFSGLLSDGEKSAEDLKKQTSLIQQVAKEWGDVVPSIAAYAAELERAARAGDILRSAQATQDQIAANLIVSFRALTKEHTNAISLVPDANREYGILAGKMESGAATAEDFQRVLDALNSVLQQHTSPAISDAVAALIAMQAQAAGAAAQMAAVGNEAEIAAGKVRDFAAAQAMRDSTRAAVQDQSDFVKEQERINGLSKEQLALEKEIASVKRDAKDAGTVVDADTAARLAADRLAAEKARADAAKEARKTGASGESGADKAAKEAEREREAVTKLIEQLEFEQVLIGLTAVEKEKANALRRAGAAATEEERARIADLVEANYAQVEAIRANEQALNNLKSVSKDVLGGMFEDLRDGASAADILGNALNRVAEAMVKAGIDAAISGIFAGGNPFSRRPLSGTNLLASVHHEGGVVGAPGPMRSVPASAFLGAPRYHGGGIAGIRPGEIPAILQRGETVLPRGAGGGGDVTVQVINAPAGTTVQESRGADGGRMIKVLIKQATKELLAEGSLDRDFASNFGIRRVAR